ncbi:MAG: hypothetical protein ACYC64_09805 [Armatimonadota bacterium]
MTVSDLAGLLRTDLADPNKERFSDEVLARCVWRSIYPVAWDLDVSLTVVESLIDPVPSVETQEMILLQARIEACRFMRAATANAFSFSSGDKRVDKTSQTEHWAKLEADLTASYQQRLHDLRPETSQGDYILTPKGLKPVAYEQGIDLETTV